MSPGRFLLLVPLLAGCGLPSGEPARFSGHYGPPRLGAPRVHEVAERPSGYRTLGTVTARCRADSGVRALSRAPLGDVDCSDALLVASLARKAEAVGGDLLVGKKCETEEDQGDVDSVLHTCTAKVASAMSRGFALPAPPPEERPSLPFADVDDAFRVAVTVVPLDTAGPARAARDPDRVGELAVLPASHVVQAHVIARCKGECGRDAVRYAVRAGAARVGATDVVGIACVKAPKGYLCTGQAARPEVDPELSADAR